MPRPIHFEIHAADPQHAKRVGELGGTIVVPKMAIPTVGWLTYGHDTEGNVFGMMQMDAAAK